MKRIVRGIILLIALFALPIGILNAQTADTTSYNSEPSWNDDEQVEVLDNDENSDIIYVDEDLETKVVNTNGDINEDQSAKKSKTSKKEGKDEEANKKQKEEVVQAPPEKGLYIGLGLGVGGTDFHYQLKESYGDGAGHCMRLGGQAGLHLAYYFTRNWGISLGAGVSLYRSMGQYKGLKSGNYFDLGTRVINENRSGVDTLGNIRARLLNWQELESSYFIDIPLMLQYQTKWGKGKHGMYFGIGVKYQLPFNSKYSVIDSKYSSQDNTDPDTWRLNISMVYQDDPYHMGDLGAINAINDTKGTLGIEVPAHGLGTITNPNELLDWNGKLSIKGSWTGVAEMGFLFGLSRRVDLTLGAYFEYGFNNIEKGDDKQLMTAPDNYLFQFENNPAAKNVKPIGTGIEYAGLINSTQTPRTNLMAVGLKVGARIKIGKLKARDPWAEEPEIVKAVKDTTPLRNIEDRINLLNQNQPTTLIIKDGNGSPQYPQDPNDPNNPYKRMPTNAGLTSQEEVALECCIYFDYAKFDIRTSEIWCLEQKLAILKAHPEIKMRVLGNTCDMYGDEINTPLGYKRAQAAIDWLVQRGISRDRLIPISQSKYRPQVANDSEAHRRLNRRADFEIMK